MSEIKWIKITTNIFDDEKIKLIEKLPEGDTMLVIWLKLLTLAGRKNDSGLIYITKDIPFTPDSLADVIGRDSKVVKLALNTFVSFEMIHIFDSFIQITNWEKHQNVEAMAKLKTNNTLRKQNERNRKTLLENMYNGLNQSGFGKCAYCGQENELTLDHIIPVSKGGLDVIENFELICKECNSSKSNRDLAIFLNELMNSNKINIQSVVNNKKIMNFVKYDNKKFYQKNTMLVVTSRDCHDIDKNRLDKNRLDKNRLDKNRLDKNRLDKNRLDKNRLDSFFIDILNYWNLKNIRNHKEKIFFLNINSSSNALKKSFKEIKKEFTLETIKKAIDNYKTILESEKYFWSKKWNCWEFLTRGLLKFIDDASPFDNYLNFNQVDKKPEENNNRKIRNNGKIITEDEYLKKQLNGFVDRQFPEDIKFYKEKIKEKEFQEKLKYIFKNKKKPENVKEIDYKDIIFYIKSKFFILKDGEFVANSDLSIVLENAKKLESKSIMKEIEGKRK